AVLIEADTDWVHFSMPAHPDGRAWSYDEELALIEDLGRSMPVGIQVEHDGRYQAMYSYMEKNYVLLDYEQAAVTGFRVRDRIRPVGIAFRSSRVEPLVDRFLAQALRLLLLGE